MNVELANRRPHCAITRRNQLKPGPRGHLDMVGVHIVFNHVDNASLVVECSAMTCTHRLRMEVRDEHASAGPANTREFQVSRKGIADMAKNKPRPHQVEFARPKWHCADVSSNNGMQAPRRQHLWA